MGAPIVVQITGDAAQLEGLIQRLLGALERLSSAGARTSSAAAAATQRLTQTSRDYSAAVQAQVNGIRGLQAAQTAFAREGQEHRHREARALEQNNRLAELRERIDRASVAAARERAAGESRSIRELNQAQRNQAQAEFRAARERDAELKGRAAGELRNIREQDRAANQRAAAELRAIRESDRELKNRAAGELRAIREREQQERAAARRASQILAQEQRQRAAAAARDNAIIAGIVAGATNAAINLAVQGLQRLVDTLRDAVSLGLQFNATMETAQVGMAAIIVTQNTITDAQGRVLEGAEAFNHALSISGDLVDQLRIKALAFGLPFQETLVGLQTIQGPLTNAGLKLSEIVDLAPKLALGLRAANVPLREIGQETRAILNGTQTRNDRLNQILNITKKEVEEAKKAGTLYEFLNSKLEGFTAGGIALANTYTAIFERLSGAASILAGKITEPLFEGTKAAGAELFGAVLNTKEGSVQESLKGLVDIGQQVFGRLGDLVQRFVGGLVRGLQLASQFLSQNRQQVLEVLNAFGILGGVVFKILGFLARMVVETTAVLVKSGFLAGMIKFIATGLFVTLEAWKAVKLAIETVGLAIQFVVLGPIAALLKALGLVAKAMNLSIADPLNNAANTLFGRINDQADAAGKTFKEITKDVSEFVKKLNEPAKPVEIKVKPKLDTSGDTVTAKPIKEDDEDTKREKKKTEDWLEFWSDYYRERHDLNTQFLQLTGQEEAAHLRETQARYRDFALKATVAFDVVGLKLVADLINIEQIKFRVDRALREVGRLGSGLQDRLQRLSAEREAGRITPAFANEQTRLAIRQTIAEYERLIATMEKQLRLAEAVAKSRGETFSDPETVQAIQRLRTEIVLLDIDLQKMDDTFFNLRDNLQGPVEQAFNSFFDNIISRNRTILQSFGDLAKGIIQSIAKVIREMIIAMAVKKLLDAVFSTKAFSGGSLTSVVGSVAGAGVGEFAEGTPRLRGPGTSTSDSILARVSRDESIIPARSAQYYGYDFMDALIGMRVHPQVARMGMRLPGYAGGVSRVLDRAGVGAARDVPGSTDRLEVGLEEGLVVRKMSGREGERWFLEMASKHRRTIGRMGPRTGR